MHKFIFVKCLEQSVRDVLAAAKPNRFSGLMQVHDTDMMERELTRVKSLSTGSVMYVLCNFEQFI